jgi:hemin uptake protein HemP
MTTTRLKIGPLDATGAAHLEKAVEAVPRVSSVELKPGEDELVVEHDGASLAEIVAALREEGYEPRVVEDSDRG